MSIFKSKPVASLITVITVLYSIDTALIATHTLTGAAAAWATALATILSVILGVVTHGNVTPTANPRDNAGHRLTPEHTT